MFLGTFEGPGCLKKLRSIEEVLFRLVLLLLLLKGILLEDVMFQVYGFYRKQLHGGPVRLQ